MNEVDDSICPRCGAAVRVSGSGCPKCNRQRKPKNKPGPKPWDQDESRDGLDLPDDPEDFDYRAFPEEDAPGSTEEIAPPG